MPSWIQTPTSLGSLATSFWFISMRWKTSGDGAAGGIPLGAPGGMPGGICGMPAGASKAGSGAVPSSFWASLIPLERPMV